jgi:peroxiredoxin
MKPVKAWNELVGVNVGQLAPDFVARDLDDKPVGLKTLINGRKALVLFYRGGWCPYCDQQLAATSQDISKFRELGATIVAASSEEPENGKELLRKLNLPFVLLSDASFEGIDRYGVRDDNPSERTRARGITRLAKPSAFIIDGAGVVSYKYVGKNVTDRPNNEDLLRALEEADRPIEASIAGGKEEGEGDACELCGGGN